MSAYAHPTSQPQGPDFSACAGRFGPPLPVKLLGVGAAFLVCRPLGVIALGAVLFSHFRRHGALARGPWPGMRGHHRHGFGRSGNAAFDAAQQETLNKLSEDAKAFAEFARKQREARDKEAFDRFQADRAANPEAPQHPDAQS